MDLRLVAEVRFTEPTTRVARFLEVIATGHFLEQQDDILDGVVRRGNLLREPLATQFAPAEVVGEDVESSAYLANILFFASPPLRT